MAIAEEMKNLTEEIATSYATRVSTVKDLVKETHGTLQGFQRDQREMAAALKKDLAQGESQRLEAFKALDADIKKVVGTISGETSRLLSGFRSEQKETAKALKEMAAAVRTMVAKGESERLQDFRPMFGGIQRRQEERVAEVRATLGSFRKDQEEARKHWQSLAKVMAAKRAGKEAPKPKVAERVAEKTEGAREVKKEVPPEKRMTYREFFAYHRPRVEGSSKERMIKIGGMWREYQKSAGK